MPRYTGFGGSSFTVTKRGKIKQYPKKGLNTTEKKQVRKIIKSQSETLLKEYDWDTIANLSGVSYGSGAAVAGLYGALAAGAADGARVGDRIHASSVNVSLAFVPGDSQNYMRILLVGARKGVRYQPADTANFVQNLLSNRGSGGDQWSMPVDTSRFKVYYDTMFEIRKVPYDGGTAASNNLSKIIRFRRKIGKNMQWDEAGEITNDVYFVCLSDSAIASHPGAVGGSILAYYKDL